jgi:hypothetical protein
MGAISERRGGPGSVALYLTLAAAIGWGAWLRVRGIGAMPLYGDEEHSASLVGLPARELFRTYDVYGSHVPLPLLQRLCAWLTEPGILAFRLPVVAFGVLALLLAYPVGKRLVGAPAAALATLALALNPLHAYYSCFGRAYAITVCLGVALLGLLERAERLRWRSPGTLAAVALLGALLPWVHLSSAGFVLGLGLAAIGLAWARGGAREAARPAAVFALAALASLALFLPVWDQLVLYLTKVPEQRKDRPGGPFGIAVLMAGGVAGGAAWCAGSALAFALLSRERRASAALLAGALLGPIAFLVATRPHGMEYAYARYLLNALPAVLFALGWLSVRLLGARWGTLAGLGLAAAGYVAGPQSPLRPDEGAFANTYLALRPLPAFDAPFGMTPEIYRAIAADPEAELIIEAPILDSRSVFLYRNYFLTHQKRVLMGLVQSEDVRLNGPYAFIGDPQVGRKTGARYLVVHKDAEAEVQAYWGFVYTKAWPELAGERDESFMKQHRIYYMNEDLTGMAEALIPPLSNQLGPPFYEDGMVAVWKLKTGPRRGAKAERAEPGEG